MRTRIFDTVTGNPLLTVETSAASWSAKIGGSGEGSVTVPIRAQGIPRDMARDLFRANARMVAHIDDNDTVIAAGVFLTPTYDKDAGAVTAKWVDIRTLIQKRLGFLVSAWGPSGTLTVTGRSQSGAVRAIIARAVTGDASRALPIDLPDDGAGSFTRTWPYYGFTTMDDCLGELEDEGAEIFFDPYLSVGSIVYGGSLRFRTRVGAPIALDPFDLPVTAPQSAVTRLQVTEDGAKQATGVIYAGNGTGVDQLTAYASTATTGPARDEYQAAKDIKSPAQLQRIAAADLAEHSSPVVQWSFNVRLDEHVTSAAVKPGRLLKMDVRKDDWIPDGLYTQRVIGVSGDLTDTVQVEVQSYG